MTGEQRNGDDLRAALSRVSEITGDGTACPNRDRLVASARGELPRSEDGEVILHIAKCSACGTGWRVAHDVAGERENDAWVVRQRVASALGRTRWATAAAVLIVAIGGGILISERFSERDVAPAYRGQEEAVLQSLLPESEPLPKNEFVLRWVAGADGSIYDVVLTDERMRTLDRATGLTSPEYRVPPESLETVDSGARLFWQVSARSPDGRRSESATFIASVR
jgi:hypothetical protein